MSNNVIAALFERASEAIEYCTNSPDHMDEQLQKAWADNDLTQLDYLTRKVEALMSQEDYYDSDTY